MKKAMLGCGEACCEKLAPRVHLKGEKNSEFIVFLVVSENEDEGKGKNVVESAGEGLLESIRGAKLDLKELTLVLSEKCFFVDKEIFARMPKLLTALSRKLPDFRIGGILIRQNEYGGASLVNFYPG